MASSVDKIEAPVRRDGIQAWIVAVLLMLCVMFSNMDRAVLALVFVPIEKQFGLDDTSIGLIQGTAFGLFYGSFGIILSRVADNSNRRNLIIAGLIVWCGATIACGLAVGAKTLFLSRVAVAAGEAVLLPAGISTLADYFTPRFRARAMATFALGSMIGGPMSLVCGGAILHHLGTAGLTLPALGHLESWRVVFLAIGGAGLILVPFLLCIKEPPRLDELGRSAGAKLSAAEVLAVFRTNGTALFCTIVGFALIGVGSATLQSWLPTLFVRNHHWATSDTGYRLGFTSAAVALTGVALAGILSDALHNRGFLAAKPATAAATSLFAATGALFLITAENSALAFGGAMVSFFFMSIGLGMAQAAIAQLLPNRVRGLGSALNVATVNLLTATTGPLAVGLLTDHVFHDQMALPSSLQIVVSAIFLLSFAILWAGVRPYRRYMSQQQAQPPS